MLDFAQELLRIGTLRESDWCGDLTQSINQGLSRWINEDLGGARLKIFKPLAFHFTNDARRYFTDIDDRRWRHHMNALDGRAVGFFGFAWSSETYRQIYVADRIQELNRLIPNLGWHALLMIHHAFRWSVHGFSLADGMEKAMAAEEDIFVQWVIREKIDVKTLASAQRKGLVERFHTELAEAQIAGLLDMTALTVPRFKLHVPAEACIAAEGFGFDAFDAMCDEYRGRAGVRRPRGVSLAEHVARVPEAPRLPKPREKYRRITDMLIDLAILVDDSSRTHIGGPHHGLIYDASQPVYTNTSVVMRWHPDDEQSRIVDDEYGSRMFGLKDLVWQHGFQLGNKGRQSTAAAPWRKAFKKIDQECNFAPDGSLETAVESVKRFMALTQILDELLTWLDRPPKGAERDLAMAPRMTGIGGDGRPFSVRIPPAFVAGPQA